MAFLDFNRLFICSGTESVLPGQKSPRSVVFKEQMEGVPTVNVIAVDSAQNVIATNVTSTGFDIILSEDGPGTHEANKTFQVHYTAIFLR